MRVGDRAHDVLKHGEDSAHDAQEGRPIPHDPGVSAFFVYARQGIWVILERWLASLREGEEEQERDECTNSQMRECHPCVSRALSPLLAQCDLGRVSTAIARAVGVRMRDRRREVEFRVLAVWRLHLLGATEVRRPERPLDVLPELALPRRRRLAGHPRDVLGRLGVVCEEEDESGRVMTLACATSITGERGRDVHYAKARPLQSDLNDAHQAFET